MVKTTGAKDQTQRVRRENTEEELNRKAVARADKKAKTDAEKKAKSIIDKTAAKATFFVPRSERQTAIDKDVCETGDVTAGSNTADANINNVEQAHEDVINNANDGITNKAGSNTNVDVDDARNVWRPADIEVNLHSYDDEDEQFDGASVMGIYRKRVIERLQYELGGKFKPLDKPWLLDLLKIHEFRLRSIFAKSVCKQLRILFSEEAYYRDIVIWLPDVQHDGIMPPCVVCHSATHVVVHSWQTNNHYGRLIYGMKEVTIFTLVDMVAKNVRSN